MIDWFVSTAVAVSILILVVLVLRGLVARHFGARAAFALWLAPLLRVILPPLVEWAGGASSGPGAAGASALPELIIVQVPAASSQGAIMPWLVGLWAGGSMLYLGVQLVRHHQFIGRALARGIRLAPRGVPYDVIASDAVEGPLATGLVHPLILVPADFSERFTPPSSNGSLCSTNNCITAAVTCGPAPPRSSWSRRCGSTRSRTSRSARSAATWNRPATRR